jgi:hypothetical protein
MLACRIRVPLLRGQPFGQPLQATLDHLRIPIVAKRADSGLYLLEVLAGAAEIASTRPRTTASKSDIPAL